MSALRVAIARVGLSGASLLTILAASALAVQFSPPVEVRKTAVMVRFIEPAPPALIQGPTRITVEASTEAGARIVSVAIYVDGTLISILENPPYTLTWNAGTRFLYRKLRAVATDSQGRTGAAEILARPLLIGQYEEVRLVNVYATVRDGKGRPVLDLTQNDFTLYENGVPQTVTHFSSARAPLTVALLIDASNSMNLGGKLELARRAAKVFVKSVDPDDRLIVLHFNDRLHGSTEPSRDAVRLEAAIDSIEASGGTALYDAVFRTSDLLAEMEGRRAIVLLSDGRDQALTENEPGSLHLFEEALRKAHRTAVAIYAIGLGRHLDKEFDLQRVRSLKEILEIFSRETGGRAYFPDRPRRLSRIYKALASDLQQQYTLGYTSTNRARDGAWRAIDLHVRPPELKVEARSGYYAPGPGNP